MVHLSLLKKCSTILENISLDDVQVTFSTDTRKYQYPEAFIAIPGEKFNPLEFVEGILDKGCPYLFYEKKRTNDDLIDQLKQKFKDTYFISVSNILSFIQELAHHHITSWQKKDAKKTLFAISGSNGKTTHKEMLAHLLSQVLPSKVVFTEKNNNNHLGVPLTLLRVRKETEVVILELGSNHPGEIKTLCEIALPNAGITTNIGATHLEFFENEENVFLEESYLYHSIMKNTDGRGLFFINLDDAFLKTLHPTLGSITFSQQYEAMAKFDLKKMSVHFKNHTYHVDHHHVTGHHNKLNLLTCVFIASLLYPDLQSKFEEAAQSFRPTKNRSEWIEVEESSIFLDAYNANPSSMKIALQGFKDHLLDKRLELNQACLVLGDMNELGDKAADYHEDVGQFLRDLGFVHAYFIGRYAEHYAKGFCGGMTRASSKEFRDEYKKECLNKFPIHFVKGSRSLQLEFLFDIT